MNPLRIAALLALALCLAPGLLQADAGYPTASELPLLPPFCKARSQYAAPGEAERWRSIMGYKNWTHMHHYCQDLNLIRRAELATNRDTRNGMLKDAKESLYRFDAAVEPGFALRGEVHYNIGRAASMLGNKGEAIGAYQKSIQITPRYVPSYVALSDVYRETGQRDEARKIIDKGLAKAPKSKALLKRKAQLGAGAETADKKTTQESAEKKPAAPGG
jgi:tetratricopeptide (TPR) repeat protein